MFVLTHLLAGLAEQNLLMMSSRSCCLWQQCWYHSPSSSLTLYNEHFTQILSPLSLSTTLSPSFTSLCLFFLSLFSQLDSRDNNGVSVSFLQILFSNQLANKHCSPVLFPHFPIYFCLALSLYSCLPKALFPQTKSPVILNIPTFLSAFHFSLAAWIVLIASFGLHGHPLACYCGLHYEQHAGITIQQCRSAIRVKHWSSQQYVCDLLQLYLCAIWNDKL